MEGADIYQTARNCRTSVEMIEKYFAAYIKTSLGSVAINVIGKTRNARKRFRTLRLYSSISMRKGMCKIGHRALS
jgi:hypothetical protein